MSAATPDLHAALKRHFGFEAFRPLQEEIVRATLAGRDLLALLPTGGGKSLCYQLPALLTPGLTVVVSPLIALMEDQVGQLEAAGIPATFLNSSLDGEAARERFRRLHRDELKLLYLSPERLAMPQFLATLKGWNVSRFAIDEAHCISEWGHDFRPEYRQLAALRDEFPGVPFSAFTASATPRVGEDILAQLRIDAAARFTAGFNRPNLTYRVVPKDGATKQIVEFLRTRKGRSGIVYAQSRAGVERIAEKLKAAKIKALPYHAGLDAETRTHHQELFRKDKVEVIVATIAFGMGVHKPDIRFVIHHDLPKSLEGYYQETGRAGRDGEPSDCLLLYSRGDLAKLTGFLDEIQDAEENAHAHAMLRKMADFCESPGCRRRALLAHFGDAYPEENCGGCDNCLEPKGEVDATAPAQKLLSCAFRVERHRGFALGLTHLADVLRGADTEKIRQWGHETLSVYGIGKDVAKADWVRLGRELIRLGLLTQSADKFGTITLSAEGGKALKERRAITVTPWQLEMAGKAGKSKSRRGASEGETTESADPSLFERLRALRRALADARGVPPYFIFSDATLRTLASRKPRSESEFADIPGVGEKKLKEFAADFLAAIAVYETGA